MAPPRPPREAARPTRRAGGAGRRRRTGARLRRPAPPCLPAAAPPGGPALRAFPHNSGTAPPFARPRGALGGRRGLSPGGGTYAGERGGGRTPCGRENARGRAGMGEGAGSYDVIRRLYGEDVGGVEKGVHKARITGPRCLSGDTAGGHLRQASLAARNLPCPGGRSDLIFECHQYRHSRERSPGSALGRRTAALGASRAENCRGSVLRAIAGGATRV